MSIAHLFEDFATTDPSETATLLMSNVELEEQRLAAFEKGYTEGWDDAVAADAQHRTRLSEALSHNLKAATFTHQEAYRQMQVALVPVFDAISEQLLPTVIESGMPLRLAPILQEMAARAVSGPIVVTTPIGTASGVAPLLPNSLPIEVLVRESSALSEGQAQIHLDDSATEIDLTDLAEEMRAAFAAYSYAITQEQTHEQRR